jgi:RNA polymerase sigma-70 factor (ECF subfamily)
VDLPTDSEADLISAAARGDARAFGLLFSPLIEPGLRLAFTMLRDPHAAEDAVQEATLLAWRKVGQVRAARVGPWFYAIVANQCRASRRSRWWHVLKTDTPFVEAVPELDAVEAGVDLARGLRSLRPIERAALYLYYYLDLPLDEVAQVLGLSVSAARSRISRAAKRLRADLVEEL